MEDTAISEDKSGPIYFAMSVLYCHASTRVTKPENNPIGGVQKLMACGCAFAFRDPGFVCFVKQLSLRLLLIDCQ